MKSNRSSGLGGVVFCAILFTVALVVLISMYVSSNFDQQTNDQVILVGQPDMTVKRISNIYDVDITGSAKNTSNKTLSVAVTFTIYDSLGNVVGTASDFQSNLGPGETWIYNAIGLSNTNRPVSCKCTELAYR